MIFVDDGAEKLVLDGEFDIAIPFSVSREADGEPKISVFPSQKAVADEFLHRYGASGELFSPEAVAWAKKQFEPYFVKIGFAPADDSDAHFLNFHITDPHSELILPATRELDGSEDYENLTGYDFAALNHFGHICFGCVVDDKIVSAATTNYSFMLAEEEPDTRTIEIGVETAEKYRNQGYGLSCTAALACFLIDKGYTVLYECGSDNEASIALAKKLGGIQSGKNFCVVGHRISD